MNSILVANLVINVQISIIIHMKLSNKKEKDKKNLVSFSVSKK